MADAVSKTIPITVGRRAEGRTHAERPGHLVRVAVPRLNKCDWISEYLRQMEARDYDLNWAEVIETRWLAPAEWNEFCGSLLEDREWLAGKGGASSWAVEIPDANRDGWISMSESDRELFRETSYLHVVAVRCAGSVLYVDPEGYGYARYVAFPADDLPEGRSRQEIRREEERAAAEARAAERRRALENPPAVAADHGLKFFWNGIKANGGKLEPVQYSKGALISYQDDNIISIYARDYNRFSDRIRSVFHVTNDSDSQSDYFADDTIRLLPAHPLYPEVLRAFEAQQKHYADVTTRREARWRRARA